MLFLRERCEVGTDLEVLLVGDILSASAEEGQGLVCEAGIIRTWAHNWGSHEAVATGEIRN